MSNDKIKLLAGVLINLLVLGAALFVFLSPDAYPANSHQFSSELLIGLAWKIHEAPGLSRDTKASVC